ncbi:cell wall-binding repeat-containing protein [Orlajensenia leifsoniae]|uniref:cell wall-binding repeat-containing protein n=1 Tax=Orlajensenia leifsoniae TaxID=2561933 RepID=UPI001958A773|nr:cell wall-binding repeat-containing protein [Leifsonia flava]
MLAVAAVVSVLGPLPASAVVVDAGSGSSRAAGEGWMPVSGTVRGRTTSGTVPIPGATISFYDGAYPVDSGWSGADGAFTMSAHRGQHHVKVEVPTRWASQWYGGAVLQEDSTMVTVLDGYGLEGLKSLDFVLEPRGSLSGSLVGERGNTNVSGTATAFVKSASTGKWTAAATARIEKPHYSFDNLAPASYRIGYTFYAKFSNEFWPKARTVGTARTITIDPGEAVEDVDSVLTQTHLTVSRIGGRDRFEVAAKLSHYFPATAGGAVLIANGLGYADALAAGAAGALRSAPLLLVTPTGIPQSTRTELKRLAPSRIIIIGGTASVSAGVEAELQGYGGYVSRLSGADRYGTSRDVARWATRSTHRLYLATGLGFADALSAGPIAGLLGSPLVLVNGASTTADPATRQVMKDLGAAHLSVVGGAGAMNPGIAHSLHASTTTVYGGADRYETSRLVNGILGADTAFLAVGDNFPDALSAGPASNQISAGIYLVHHECIPQATMDMIDDKGITNIVLLGGEAALSSRVAELARC